jgi:HemY protein
VKRLFFFIGLSLIAGAFIFQQTANGNGYILIALGNTTVEMSFWTGLFLLLAGLLAMYLALRLITGTYRLLTGDTHRLGAVSGKAVQRRTALGLIAFIEGHWKQARKHLLKSAKNADYPLINYLAAARSSYELGDEGEAFELLHKAEQVSPDSGLAIALTQARMLLVAKKYEQCLANLERARKIAPHHPVVLDLLQRTYVQLEDWRSLQKLLPDLRRHNMLGKTQLSRLESQLYEALLVQAGNKAKSQSREEGLAIVNREWQSVPAHWRKQAAMQTVYVQQLLKVGAEDTAEVYLRKELKRNWHEPFVAIYGRVAGRDTKKQLLVAEHWQQERPGDAVLLRTLGRLCLRNKEWARAKDYFESSLKLRKDPETYAEQARLLAHLGEYQKSTEYYQHGLLMTTAGLPDLPMPAAGDRQLSGHFAKPA